MKKLLLILLCLPFIGFGQEKKITNTNTTTISGTKTLWEIVADQQKEQGMFYIANGKYIVTQVAGHGLISTRKLEKRCLEEIKKFGDEKKYIYEVKNIEKQKAGYGRLAQVSITVLFKHSEGGTIITEEDKKREKEEIKGRIKELQEYLEMGVITQEEYNSEIEKIRKKILSE